ncbi:hypothetical protein M8494_02765 [Serratia ureilytica]
MLQAGEGDARRAGADPRRRRGPLGCKGAAGFFGEVNLWLDERMTERTAFWRQKRRANLTTAFLKAEHTFPASSGRAGEAFCTLLRAGTASFIRSLRAALSPGWRSESSRGAENSDCRFRFAGFWAAVSAMRAINIAGKLTRSRCSWFRRRPRVTIRPRLAKRCWKT